MWAFLALLPVASAFFFGGSSCGCQQPSCPPPPPSPCCGGCGGGGSYAAPQVLSGVAGPAYGGFQQQASFPSAGFQQPLGLGVQQPVGQALGVQQPVYQQQAPSYAQPQVQQPVFQPQPQIQAQPQPTYQNTAPVQQPEQPPVVQQSYQEAPAQVQAVPQQSQEGYQASAPQEVQPAAEEQPAQYREDNNNVEVAAAASKNAEVIEEASEKSKSEGKTIKSGKDEKGEEKVVDISQLKLTDDPLCNSDDLRNLMLTNMDDNLNSSKRLIQLAAEAQFGGRFDVICANGDFSYVTNTELFCQETKANVSCYTYRQL